MKNSITILTLFIFASTLFGQRTQGVKMPILEPDQIAKVDVQKQVISLTLSSKTLAIPLENPSPFISYSVAMFTEEDIEALEKNTTLWIRFSENSETWSDWNIVERESHAETKDTFWYSTVMFTDKSMRFFQFMYEMKVEEKISPTKANIHFYSPGDTPKWTNKEQRLESRSDCECQAPTLVTRNAWCPDGTCPAQNSPIRDVVSHIIIHHSAGTNQSNDWAAIVRAIWSGHVNTNGWSDVGYNWLITPDGTFFEGRGSNVRGAHFCGRNTGTEGICMVGTYMTQMPTEVSLNTLNQFLAWRSCELEINPMDRAFHPSSGLNLLRISGHRDGCATSCPGDAFYPTFHQVRENAVRYAEENCGIATSTNIIEHNAPSLTVSPNPFQQSINVLFNSAFLGTIDVSIWDITGKKVYQTQVFKDVPTLQHNIQASNLTSGIYVLSIMSEAGTVHQKLVNE